MTKSTNPKSVWETRRDRLVSEVTHPIPVADEGIVNLPESFPTHSIGIQNSSTLPSNEMGSERVFWEHNFDDGCPSQQVEGEDNEEVPQNLPPNDDRDEVRTTFSTSSPAREDEEHDQGHNDRDEDDNDNDIKGESVGPFTLDMAIDLENRIQKLEKVIANLKEARFGQFDC